MCLSLSRTCARGNARFGSVQRAVAAAGDCSCCPMRERKKERKTQKVAVSRRVFLSFFLSSVPSLSDKRK